MRKLFSNWARGLRVRTFLNTLALVALIGIVLLNTVIIYLEMRSAAIRNAEEKAQLIVQRNLATHQYFKQALKPSVFRLAGASLDDNYFDPIWMSSSYAVRQIDGLFQAASGMGGYAYKEASIDARNVSNEADPAERAFLQAVNRDAALKERSDLLFVGKTPFLNVMVRGETIDESCLLCHGTPDRAPRGLTAHYGSQRGFGRSVGQVVSAISVRVPLAGPLQSAFSATVHSALVLTLALAGVYLALRLLVKHWLLDPLEMVQEQALATAADEHRLGEQLISPPGRELGDLVAAFNRLSSALRSHQNELEERIRVRTHELEQSQHLIQQILDLTPSALCLLDTRLDRFIYVNKQICDFYGIPAEKFLQKGAAYAEQAIHPDDLPLYQELRARLETTPCGEVQETQLRARGGDGDLPWLAFRGLVIERGAVDQRGADDQRGAIDQRGADDRPLLILFIVDDITSAHEAQAKLLYTSTHDALTGLYNWAYFEERLVQIRSTDSFPVTVVMMDVDNLKVINDSVGHVAGDTLLRAIGGSLLTLFRADDVVARLGGDEFAALLPRVDHDAAAGVARSIRSRLSEATLISGIRLDVVSIGVSTANDAAGLEKARHLADQRMYQDKQQRKAAAK